MNEISSFLFGKEAGKEAKGKDGRDGRMGTGMYVCMYGRDWWDYVIVVCCCCCCCKEAEENFEPFSFYDSNTLRNTMPKRTQLED